MERKYDMYIMASTTVKPLHRLYLCRIAGYTTALMQVRTSIALFGQSLLTITSMSLQPASTWYNVRDHPH